MAATWRVAVLVFSAILSQAVAFDDASASDDYNIHHEAGYCVWTGECAKSPTGMYNCFYNGPAKTFYEDTQFFKDVNETCPHLVNQTHPETSTICCDSRQLDTLKNQIKVAQPLFERCPACYQNFLQHFCMTTCDPNMALWFDIPSGSLVPMNATTSYVKSVTLYITLNYANSLYDSCDNVQYPENNNRVIDIMCGGVDSCNSTLWLNYLGNPKLDAGQAPFLMVYNASATETVPNRPNMTAENHTFYSCNSSEPSLRCSCADCPAPNTCPPLPSEVSSHFNYPLVAGLIGGIGGVASIIICVVTLAAAIWTYMSRQKGYVRIAGESEPHSNYGTMNGSTPTVSKEKEGDSPSSSVGSINADDLDLDPQQTTPSPRTCGCCQHYVNFGHHFEYVIKKLFYHWGRFCAAHWYLVLFFVGLITIALSCGMFFLNITSDPVKLWAASNSRARLEKDYFDEHFGPFYRTEQLIITAPGFSNYSINPVGAPAKWTFGPVLTRDVLEEVYYLQNNISSMNVSYTPTKGGPPHIITLSDICFKPVNDYCTIESVINYFQNDYTRLMNETVDGFGTVTYNGSFHIYDCVRNPTSPQGRYVDYPCLGQFGGPIDPNTALGGFEKNPNADNFLYETATAMLVTFIVNNHVDEGENKMAETWEREFLRYMKSYKGKYIEVAYSSERSIADEIERESETDIATIGVSYGLMFLYVTIFLGHIRSFATIMIDLKVYVGLSGVLMVIVAVVSALGFFGYVGLTGSLIILEVIPFLVLAVGVDNLFIMVHSYERQVKKYAKHLDRVPVSELIGRALGEVAPSLLLTSLSESAAFLLGGISTMPAVKSFSFYAGVAVFFNFLLQVTAFVAVLSLDARRQLANRFDVFVCFRLKDKFDPKAGKDFLFWFMRKFAKFVLYPFVRPFILLVFGFTFTASLALIFRIKIGLDQNAALPKDSYLMTYFDKMNEYLHIGPPVYFVIKEGYNYSDPVKQNALCSGADCSSASFGTQIAVYARLPDYTRIAEPAMLWVDTYFEWVSPISPCCGYNASTHQECYDPAPGNDSSCKPCVQSGGTRPNVTEFEEYLEWFLNDNPGLKCASGGHAAFKHAVPLRPDNKTVISSYAMTYHTILKDSPDFIAALRHARTLTDNLTETLNVTVFPYSIFYVFYEQYLTTVPDMILNIGVSLAAVYFVSFLMMGLNLWAATVVIATVGSIVVHMLGCMALFSINANAVSLVNLVMTVGIAVEFCSHIIRWFVSCSLPSRRERALSALSNVGASVFSGITVTKFLGVFVLLFAKSPIFEIYYFRMYMCMLVWGALHGLILLPVVLSYVGPAYCPPSVHRDPYNTANLKLAAQPSSGQTQSSVVHSRPTQKGPDLDTYHVDGGGQYVPPYSGGQYPPATYPRQNGHGVQTPSEQTRLVHS